jgi:hypothetical protein
MEAQHPPKVAGTAPFIDAAVFTAEEVAYVKCLRHDVIDPGNRAPSVAERRGFCRDA